MPPLPFDPIEEASRLWRAHGVGGRHRRHGRGHLTQVDTEFRENFVFGRTAVPA